MVINKHGSFYVREGWPTKILLEVRNNPRIFSPNPMNELQAVDSFGLGRVMIKALRYWSKAMGLTIEHSNSQGLIVNETDLFRLLYDYDVYCQDKATPLLLHREMAINCENATAWYWLFNEYSRQDFTRDDFCSGFRAFLAVHGENYQPASIEKEFNCLRSTYVSDVSFSVSKIMEDNITPFFGPLHILERSGRDIYEKRHLTKADIPAGILLYCILKDNEEELSENSQISIDKLLEDKLQVGRYFSIQYSGLIEILQELENAGKLKIFNNFGNRHIELNSKNAAVELDNYYKSIK